MPKLSRFPAFTLAALALLIVGTGCTKKRPPPIALSVSLFGGVSKLARMGDQMSHVLASAAIKPTQQVITSSTDLGKLGFTDMAIFDDVGVRAYFRNEKVFMIEISEPFPGTVEGKSGKAFPSGNPPEGSKTWEEALIRKFGVPKAKAQGGSLGTAALFYSWGDITFNRMGPTQLALYQAADIANFRQVSFAKNLKLFNK